MEPSEQKPYQRSRQDTSWATPPAIHVWCCLRFGPGPQAADELAGRLGWHLKTTTAMLTRLRFAGFAAFNRKTGEWTWRRDPIETLRLYSGGK